MLALANLETMLPSGDLKTMAGEDHDNASSEVEQLFERYRALLFSIAYSIVGTARDAQELTHETLQRWLQCSDHKPCNARTFLVTTVASLGIEYLQHSELPQDPPVPFATGDESDRCPLSEYVAGNSTSTAVLTLLNHLTPTERIIFLLHTIFKYDYSQIAQAIGKDEVECREIAQRVREFLIRNRDRADFNRSLYVSQI